jgi:hypothetical protein
MTLAKMPIPGPMGLATDRLRPGKSASLIRQTLTSAESTRRLAGTRPTLWRRQRFEGKHPLRSWSFARNEETPQGGYAPSEYQKKPWPNEALLEGWCPLYEEAHERFAIVASPAVRPITQAPTGDANCRKITCAAGGLARCSSVKATSASRPEITGSGDDGCSLFLTAVSLEGTEKQRRAECPQIPSNPRFLRLRSSGSSCSSCLSDRHWR